MKPWYTSKTLWINTVAALALIVQSRTGFVIDAEIQAALLTIINIVLRVVTGQEVGWGKPTGSDGGDDSTSGPGLGAIVPLILCACLISACATPGSAPADPVIIGGKSLVATQRTIVALAVQADALCDQGALKSADCAKISAAYALAKPAYDAAADALLLAMHSDNPAAAEAYAAKEAAFARLAQDVIRLAGQMGVTAGGAP